MVLICGLSRAGKTFFAKRYEEVIHLDDYHGKTLTDRYARCTEHISGDVVVEGLFHTAESRKALVAKGEGTMVCIWMDTDTDIILQRLGVIAPRGFEPPTLSEGWDEIIRIANYERRATYQ